MPVQRSGGTLRVAGPTRLEEVDARAFDAAGQTEVAGDVRADRATLAGATSVGGDVACGRLSAAGETHVGGDLSADSADLRGATGVEGRADVEHLTVEGAARFDAVSAEAVDATGALRAGEASAERFAAAGAVAADRVSAASVSLALGDAESRVGSVVAESATVERADGSFDPYVDVDPDVVGRADDGDGRFDAGRGDDVGHPSDEAEVGGRLVVERIDARRVEVEHTTAGTVEGERVVVGPGSRVERVLARDVEVHDDAVVESVERVE